MLNPLRSLVLVCLSLVLATACAAQSIADNQRWAIEARRALDQLDYKSAAKAADKIAKSPATDEFQRVAADTLLRCGESKRAIELFERYLTQRPNDRPYLWQLGIAYYFAGRFKDGAKLFEIHREVNPNDVENAAWHFLCVAKAESPEKAKQLLLPAPNDSRAPMEEVLQMFHSGDVEPVKERMNSFTSGSAASRSANFYGHFYLGLYADALADEATAKKHLDIAAKDAPRNYMGDIAKVYAAHLKPKL
ncbi:Anaphase-promoting complex, cyclosome, subunit 3 [Stieleria maiorica]|uniref:Anaphase-promoting complex, cyclosome, subunit 3 n=1 Tax=Stieleria maiorica TaxID=2795974 RepID=A0A5B9M729_9BACT|nr:tetratricopeptide repeat protein [Stieleria maiorica]QEF96932.1 Anaphase-promoting complex, cyclosome, subunit 3 [Stieleria maiorica]